MHVRPNESNGAHCFRAFHIKQPTNGRAREDVATFAISLNYLLRFVHSPSTINRKRQFYCSLCFILMQFANAKLHSPFLTLKRAQPQHLHLNVSPSSLGFDAKWLWLNECVRHLLGSIWRGWLAAASPHHRFMQIISLVYQFYRTFTIRKVPEKASLPHSTFRQADEE